jgi:hypothetical protein
MAEPATNLPEEDEHESIRPKLGVIQGDGQSDSDAKKSKDHLRKIEGGGNKDEEKPAEKGGNSRHLQAVPGIGNPDASSAPAGKLHSVGTSLFNPKDGQGKGSLLSRGKGKIKKLTKNKSLLIGGSSVGALVIGFILLIVFVGSLKLPDVMEGMESYAFAAVGNQFSKTTTKINDENLALKGADEDVQTGLKARYEALRDNTWGKMDVYRPDKVIENLGENNGLRIRIKKTAFGEQLEGIDIGKQSFNVEPVTGIAKWTPGLNNIIAAKNRIAFENSGYIQAINAAMKDNGTADIVRSLTMIKIERLSGGSFYGWVLSKFGNKNGQEQTPKELDAAATDEQVAATQAGDTNPDNATMTQTNQADAAGKQALRQDAQSESQSELDSSDGGWLPNVLKAVDSKLNVNLATKILHVTGFIYLIVAPICIAFDGSVKQSQPAMDNNTNAVMDSFDQLSAEADQQKQGDTNLMDGGELENAVQATNDQIGDISATNDIPYQRTYGHVQSTDGVPGAERGSDGSFSYSLLDALGGVSADSAVGKTANAIALHFCGVLTNTYTSAALTLAQIILSIASFGASEAGARAAGDGATAFITKYITSLFATKTVEDASGAVIAKVTFASRAFRFAKIQGGILVGTAALAEAAHLEVSARAGEADSGFAQDADITDQADEGAQIEANEVMRRALFGRPLLAAEVEAQQGATLTEVDYANSQKSFTDRYFALSNYDSLLTHLGMDLGANDRAENIASMIKIGGSILQPVNSLASLIGSIDGAAYAAPTPSSLDYGDVQFGWPAKEEAVIKSSTSYYMLENQRILDQSGNEAAIASEYAICFGYQYNGSGDGNFNPDDPNGDLQNNPQGTVGYLLSNRDIWRDNTSGEVINSPDNSGTCDPDKLSYDNVVDSLATDKQSTEPDGGTSPQAHDMVFRWRLAMEYLTTIDQLTKEQNITQTDDTTGASTVQAAYSNNDNGFYQPPDESTSDYALNPSNIRTVAKKSPTKTAIGAASSR